MANHARSFLQPTAPIVSKMGLIGASPKFEGLLRIVEKVALTHIPVVVLGETGTGKELVARALHELSKRSGSLVSLNSAALPTELAESLLFGHVHGAFTGASSDQAGAFAMAEHGTLFLDEIGDMPLEIQAKLLRALDGMTYSPVGSHAMIKADVRIVCATNHDLESLVRSKRFREDLYYRINVVPITVPPLRERLEDVPLLVHHFLGQFNFQNTMRVGITPEAMSMIIHECKSLGGNIRGLRSLVERAAVFASDDLITPDNVGFSKSLDAHTESPSNCGEGSTHRVVSLTLVPSPANKTEPSDPISQKLPKTNAPLSEELLTRLAPVIFRLDLRSSPSRLSNELYSLSSLSLRDLGVLDSDLVDLIKEVRKYLLTKAVSEGKSKKEIIAMFQISHGFLNHQLYVMGLTVHVNLRS